MAARPGKSVPAATAVDPVEAFKVLASFDASETDPVSTEDFAREMGVTPVEAYNALDILAESEIVDAVGRGIACEWWITAPDVSESNAESIAREALSGSVTIAETPVKWVSTKISEPTPEEATERRTEGVQRIKAKMLAKAAPSEAVESTVKAETPVIAADGKPVTIPVDFDDPSKGRRELDASKGERLIGEETIKITPKTAEVDSSKDLESIVQDGETLYESSIEKRGLALDAPDSIPATPAGVTRNFWYMAHASITQTARDSWMRRCMAEVEAHKANAA